MNTKAMKWHFITETTRELETFLFVGKEVLTITDQKWCKKIARMMWEVERRK